MTGESSKPRTGPVLDHLGPKGIDLLSGKLFAYAAKLTDDQGQCEDFVQEAMKALLTKKMSDFEHERSIYAFARKVVYNKWVDWVRSRYRQHNYESAEDVVGRLPATDVGVDIIAQVRLGKILGPEAVANPRIQAFVLYIVFEFSYEDIAVHLKTTPGNARKLASRGRKEAEAILRSRGYGRDRV